MKAKLLFTYVGVSILIGLALLPFIGVDRRFYLGFGGVMVSSYLGGLTFRKEKYLEDVDVTSTGIIVRYMGLSFQRKVAQFSFDEINEYSLIESRWSSYIPTSLRIETKRKVFTYKILGQDLYEQIERKMRLT